MKKNSVSYLCMQPFVALIAGFFVLSVFAQSARAMCSSSEVLQFEFKEGLVAELRWNAPPNSDETAAGILSFFEVVGDSKIPLSLDPRSKVAVELWMEMDMTGGGHPSLPVEVESQSCGGVTCYAVSNFWFYMDGVWQVILHLELPGKPAESVIAEILIGDDHVDGGGHHHHRH